MKSYSLLRKVALTNVYSSVAKIFEWATEPANHKLTCLPNNCATILYSIKEHSVAQKRYSDEDCLKLFSVIGFPLAAGSDVVTACQSAWIMRRYVLLLVQEVWWHAPFAVVGVEGDEEAE